MDALDNRLFREFVFSKIKTSPEYITLLAVLYPPPTHSPTPSQAKSWTKSLLDLYPEDLKDDVLTALATDPTRIIPLIPRIISKISGPAIISGPNIKYITAGPSTGNGSPDTAIRPGVGIGHVPPPSTLAVLPWIRSPIDGHFFENSGEAEPLPIPDRAPLVDVPDSARFLKGKFVPPMGQSDPEEAPRGADYMGSRPDPIPAGMRGTGNVPLHRIPSSDWPERSPALSYEGSNADSDIFAQGGFVRNNPGWDDFTRNDQGHRSPTAAKMDLPGLQAGIEEIHNGFIFRIDRDMYHLSVHKLFFLNTAYGFVIGAFSFLWLRTISYSPLAALIGSFPLALALLLIVGIPVQPRGN